MNEIGLRPLSDEDADAVFRMMADPLAREQAAFVHADPDDRAAFDAWWQRLRANPLVRDRAIVGAASSGPDNAALLGTIAAFDIEGDREVSFWVMAESRGLGVATASLALLLAEEPARPLHARAASDNEPSRRVLERAGFVQIGIERSYAEGRGAEIDEAIYRLD